MSSQERIYTVDELAGRIKRVFELDPVLSGLVVEGELSELKRHTSGHIYFTIVGTEARVSCVMFRSDAAHLTVLPRVGDRVRLRGRLDLYAPRGSVQIYARRLMAVGAGAAARAREELRLKLEKLGLFAAERKRALPSWPLTVACVTSETGAAFHDVHRVMKNRFPMASLILVPCLVQGDDAPTSIVEALRRAWAISGVQVVLLVRGGGGRDDLTPFDDEAVVMELSRSPVLVVTGVGHEVDSTLCDLVADVFGPTPSAAAERLFPDRSDVLAGLSQSARLLSSAVRNELLDSHHRINRIDQLSRRALDRRLKEQALRLDDIQDHLNSQLRNNFEMARNRLAGLSRALEALSPQSVLDRGYVKCVKSGVAVTSIGQLSAGDLVTIQLKDGEAVAETQQLYNESTH